jgi:hypothetical protein
MTQHDWISLLDAVELIAEHVYKELGDHDRAKKNARRVIEYSTGKENDLHRVPDGRSWKFNRHDFLQWAANKWPELRDHVSIPFEIEPDPSKLALTGLQPRVNLDSSDPAKLLDELNKCRRRIDEQQAEIERLRIIESNWAAHVEQDQIRRKAQGKHGEKGRGVKKNQ